MFVKSRSYWASRTSAWALATAMIIGSVSCVGADDGKRTYHIEAKSTAAALNEYARQAGVAIMFDFGEANKTTAPALNGSYTRKEALGALLANTRFVIASEVDGAIYLKVSERQGGGNTPVAVEAEPTEVVVTGTRLRNAAPASPVTLITRKDIERSGYSNAGDLARSIPQSFAGGQNPGVMQTPVEQNNNSFNSSTLNLRGLGTDANLVLVNGHRLASDGPFGGSDISGLPLGALERVEIIADGASALYGSDAVAGVANFITRKDYSGVQLGARIGGATQGGGFEQVYNVLAGHTWTGGHLLANVEYGKQDEILTTDREVTASAAPFNTLLRPTERKSLFVNIGQDITERLTFNADAYVSQHESDVKIQFFKTDQRIAGQNGSRSYMIAPGLTYRAGGDWTITADATISRGYGYYRYSPQTSAPYKDMFRSLLKSGEISGNGTLLALPGGPLKLAIGVGYRDEHYRKSSMGSPLVDQFRRNVTFAYAEALVPLVSPSDTRTGLNRLDFSVATRVEDYDRYDRTSTYKYGVRYQPVPGVIVRGTLGTSFKAPGLSELAQPFNAILYNAQVMGSTTPGVAMLLVGGNPDLKPEHAKTWTVGVDWSPELWAGSRLSVTRFNIAYRDRVLAPVTPFTQALSNPYFASFVVLAPTPQQQTTATAGARRIANFSGQTYNPATLLALVDDRKLNVSRQEIDGIDLAIRGPVELPTGDLDLFASATWLKVVQQTIASMPPQTLTGKVFNAPKVRARAGATWSVGSIVTTGIVNYLSSATDTYVTPERTVASWTTVDLTIAYRLAGEGMFSDIDLTLAVQNFFDADPPYAYGPGRTQEGINFDSANTSAIGRFVSIGLKKRF
ncbi:TonB-dependent receptor [Asticcacaulis sp. BYS171W]|uniref:TonB-dependent receptor n=1 Tax=Asticcacaulis aquaticus TaxID=2984212 RepID=A0ABT5HQ06_9CAUL|nr:TonB-dependent receptor [Asticcacaulis aquaticus]MDC7682157.1 TonB-dependent receptor [Asticcacaulis aquaticus]